MFNVQMDCGNAFAALGSVKAVINQIRAHPGRWPVPGLVEGLPHHGVQRIAGHLRRLLVAGHKGLSGLRLPYRSRR
jgi:hypothetical protein